MEGLDAYLILRKEVGEKAAQQVFRLFAGGTVNFPKRVLLTFRNIEIVGKFNQGISYEQLARTYKLSCQQIRNITSPSSQEKLQVCQKRLFSARK